MRVQGVQGQGCPQHESTQPGPLTLLPHKTRVRHKKQAQVQTVSKTSLRGVQGGPGRGSREGVEGEVQHSANPGRGVQGLGRNRFKQTRKTLRNCMARLLRSNIQDFFVQEILVGQTAQGTPFRCRGPPSKEGERGRLNLPSVQHATQGSADLTAFALPKWHVVCLVGLVFLRFSCEVRYQSGRTIAGWPPACQQATGAPSLFVRGSAEVLLKAPGPLPWWRNLGRYRG